MEQNKREFIDVASVEQGHETGASAIQAANDVRGGGGSLYARLLGWMLKGMGYPPFRVTLWTGESVGPADTVPDAHVIIRDRAALLKLILDPSVNFGDAYSSGAIEVEGNLVSFLETGYRAMRNHDENRGFQAYLSQILNRARPNSLSGSRKNISHHYDIGNDFYRLWLDERMVYTCAYFPSPTATLEEAQIAKMHHVCRKMWLQPGETVAEAGCGWGALALHMARHYGVKVKAFNISKQQILYARERAKDEGLDDRVEFIEDDYRNISGKFDAFVSVGMLEHVGVNNYRELGGVARRALKPGTGRGLIHTIGRNQPMPMNAWIEKRIFPGAYPPTLKEMMDIFEPWGLSVLDVENIRLHYAKTLDHWLQRYRQVEDKVKQMYDENFVRAWRLYLAGSEAAFTTGELQLFQVVFADPENNSIPWTRTHLYNK